jgi:hypothetical protein
MSRNTITVYKVPFGKPEGKRPLGEPMRGWKENVEKGLSLKKSCGRL